MRYLLDTGILARLPHRSDPLNSQIRDALNKINAAGHTFAASTQNIAEFWNVCTRPAEARGGFGLSIEEARKRLRLLERFITILKEPDSAYEKRKALLIAHRISGKAVHDARVAALMKAYRIKRILTLNPADFKRYSGIEVFSPADFVGVTQDFMAERRQPGAAERGPGL
jgi:predicted nucleic acid-binding protein